MTPHLLMMAGGTGGHIFPGLAVARALHERGWRVSWLGTPNGMEQTLVPSDLFPLHTVAFEGVVGRGLKPKLALPFRLFSAYRRCARLLNELRPDVVIGMGGYPTVPGGLAAASKGIPLAIHQSDAVAGLANRLLARFANRVLVGFGTVFTQFTAKRVVTGNPIRPEFAQYPVPDARFASRSGPIRLLLMGGSRGAEAINALLPEAIARIPVEQRPIVMHQAGRGSQLSTQQRYAAANVAADVIEFITDSARALADCDVFVGRSGASTVSELSSLGVASLLIPYPHHKDEQQKHNAQILADVGAAVLLDQKSLTSQMLADTITGLSRERCRQMANAALQVAKPQATEAICDIIESLAATTDPGKTQRSKA
jgi:UDP-N-acetylglucosamine--N-acetylmuramyl-(pentapeptide) pyrophosphoryl-undecaprenol N-acetylglucosamine transferase